MAFTLDSAKQHQRMTQTPIPKLVASLAIPTVISALITVIYNTADTYFVSQINKSASAAVGVVYAIMAVIQAIGYGFGMGAGSLISRRLGQKDNDAANVYASSALAGAFLVGMVISISGLTLLEPILHLLGATETMMPYAVPYAKFILLAAPVSCSSFVLNNTLRAEGESVLGMIGLCSGGLLNIALDPIFIFVLHMDAGGAALATAISQCVSAAILASHFVTKRSIVRIHRRYVSKKPADYKQIITTGLPTIFRQGLGSLAAAVLNRQAVAYGGNAADAAVSAITISNKAYVFVRNIIIGIGQGFQPVAGYNYGAGKKKRTWEAFRFTVKVGSIICIISAVVIAIFAKPIMFWFCDDAEVAVLGQRTLLLSCTVMALMAFSTYVNQLYQCLGFKAPATFLASCRQGVFFLPAVYLLPLGLGLFGVQAAQPFADLLTFLISIPFLIQFRKKQFSELSD